MKLEQANTIALKMLEFLVNDEKRAEVFLASTGLAPQYVFQGARDSTFLAGIVDYILADEKLILGFSSEFDVRPENMREVRRALPGGNIDF